MTEPEKTLRSGNIDLLLKYCGIRLRENGTERFRMVRAINGDMIPEKKQSGSNEGDKWHRMGSSYDPVYEASRWTQAFAEWNDRRTTVAMLGIGAGYQLAALMKTLRDDTEFYIYEPDEGFLYFICGYIDLAPLLETGRVHIFIPEIQSGSQAAEDSSADTDENKTKQLPVSATSDSLHSENGNYDNGIRTGFGDALWEEVVAESSQALAVRLPYYEENEIFDEACRRVRITTVMNERFVKTRGRASLKNRMHAWTKLENNYLLDSLLEILPRELPVVIVAGGPSLKINVDDLKLLKGHALIVCIDRAAGILAEHGIRPDLLATVDVVKDVAYLLPEHDPWADIPLLCSYQANIAAQEAFDGRIIYFCAWTYENDLPGLKGNILLHGNTGGSVATAVYTVFAEAGFSDIILVGQDLANRGDETHADGSDDGASVDKEFIEIEGWDGHPVKSHADWIGFRDYYEQMIRIHPDTHCIDATEGGALIHGSEVLTLKEAAARFRNKAGADRIFYIYDLPRAVTKDEQFQIFRMIGKWEVELDRFIEITGEIAELSERLSDLMIGEQSSMEATAASDKNLHCINKGSTQDIKNRLSTLHRSITGSPLFKMMRDLWIEDRSLVPDDELYFGTMEQTAATLKRELKLCEAFPTACMGLKSIIINLKL